MSEIERIVIGTVVMLLGVLIINFREKVAYNASRIYKRLGITVPCEAYAKQFGFIGTLMIIFGFIVSTNMLSIF